MRSRKKISISAEDRKQFDRHKLESSKLGEDKNNALKAARRFANEEKSRDVGKNKVWRSIERENELFKLLGTRRGTASECDQEHRFLKAHASNLSWRYCSMCEMRELQHSYGQQAEYILTRLKRLFPNSTEHNLINLAREPAHLNNSELSKLVAATTQEWLDLDLCHLRPADVSHDDAKQMILDRINARRRARNEAERRARGAPTREERSKFSVKRLASLVTVSPRTLHNWLRQSDFAGSIKARTENLAISNKQTLEEIASIRDVIIQRQPKIEISNPDAPFFTETEIQQTSRSTCMGPNPKSSDDLHSQAFQAAVDYADKHNVASTEREEVIAAFVQEWLVGHKKGFKKGKKNGRKIGRERVRSEIARMAKEPNFTPATSLMLHLYDRTSDPEYCIAVLRSIGPINGELKFDQREVENLRLSGTTPEMLGLALRPAGIAH